MTRESRSRIESDKYYSSLAPEKCPHRRHIPTLGVDYFPEPRQPDPEELANKLYRAFARGKIERALSLLSAGVNLPDPGRFNLTPLHIAAIVGDNHTLLQLCLRGADVNKIDITHNTALHYVAAYGNEEAATILMHHRADLNAKGYRKYRPLHFAANSGNLAMAEFCLLNGTSLFVRDDNGNTPEDLAKNKKDGPMMELLSLQKRFAEHVPTEKSYAERLASTRRPTARAMA